MAKRKRASIKDTSSESLGLTRRKARGIDVLFGGAVDNEESETRDNTLASGSRGGEANVLPAATAGVAFGNERAVDELGLPVALEAPPDDLILASTSPEIADPGESLNDFAMSPFALPSADVTGTPTEDPNDLSGILDNSNTLSVEGETLATSEEKTNLPSSEQDMPLESGEVESGTPGGPSTAGEATSGPTTAASYDPANDLSGLATENGMAGVPSTPPPTAPPPPPMPTQPTYNSPPPGQPYYDPNTVYTPPPQPTGPTYYAQPTLLSQAPAGVINALSTFAQSVPVTRESFAPQDEFTANIDNRLTVAEYQAKQRDEAITKRVLDYIGEERRSKLFNEIEALYEVTAKQLSSNHRDASFALDTLRQAHDLILEDPREYDEAFYRVAIVKTMLDRKANLERWSYTWGTFVLFYGIIWLVLCGLGYFVFDPNLWQGTNDIREVVVQTWWSGLAGGIGGAVAILWALYYRVSVKQDFDKQYLMWYLVKPLLGFVLGLVMYFILIAASSIFSTPTLALGGFDRTGIALSVFFGFVAGFRQDHVYDWIYVFIKTISPKVPEESQRKTRLLPPEDLAEERASSLP